MIFLFGKVFFQNFRQRVKNQLAIIIAQARDKGFHGLIVAKFLQTADKCSLILLARSTETQHVRVFFNKSVRMSGHSSQGVLKKNYLLQAVQNIRVQGTRGL